MNLFNGFPQLPKGLRGFTPMHDVKRHITTLMIIITLFSIPDIQKEIYKLKKEYRKEQLKKVGIFI